MKFSIITPTYKRSEKLKRAIDSLFLQSHSDWEMIIINDSPGDASYETIKETLSDTRIKYLINEKNSGVNYSRNRGLDSVSEDSDWVVFLDDDDYLTNDALLRLSRLIQEYPSENWIVTNRILAESMTSITIASKMNGEYNYAWDYLIFRRIRGDATHCIHKSLLVNPKRLIRFPVYIAQAEEWLFFFTLGRTSHMYYSNINTTNSDGYMDIGLNFRRRTKRNELKVFLDILREGIHRDILFSFSFCIYISMRFLRIWIK